MTLSESRATSVFKTRGPLDPVNDSALYAPRPELDRLLHAVQATTIDAYMAILGSRQTGKTTLLYQLRHRLRPRGLGAALLDLAIVRDQPEDQLYRFVASAMHSELEPLLPRAEKRESALPGNPIKFRRFMLDLARQVRAPRIVILFDEVEAVPEEYSDAFFGTLRNIFTSRRKEDEAAFEKYLIVFSGAKELHRLTSSPNSPLNIAERVYLQDLSLEGVRVIAANFSRAGVAVPAETAQWLYEQTRGHPYLTQKLCALIEQWRPENVDQAIVQRAADEALRSDDHLEKMIIQIDADPTVGDLLKQIVAGQLIPFSRLNPIIARLELLGAIRDAGQCAVRNPLCQAAFRGHFGIPETPLRPALRRIPWIRALFVLLAAIVLAVNVPFLYTYTSDILVAPRAVNELFVPAGLDARAFIRYDQILRANDLTPTNITIELEQFEVSAPITVTFKTNAPDIIRQGEARRRFDPPAHTENFSFRLNLSGVNYNPFQPTTPHRKIDLTFESSSPNASPLTYTADFRVDYYSAAIVSLAVSIGSIAAFLAGLWANVQKVRDALGFISKFLQPTTK